jgi:hypothetical protein
MAAEFVRGPTDPVAALPVRRSGSPRTIRGHLHPCTQLARDSWDKLSIPKVGLFVRRVGNWLRFVKTPASLPGCWVRSGRAGLSRPSEDNRTKHSQTGIGFVRLMSPSRWLGRRGALPEGAGSPAEPGPRPRAARTCAGGGARPATPAGVAPGRQPPFRGHEPFVRGIRSVVGRGPDRRPRAPRVPSGSFRAAGTAGKLGSFRRTGPRRNWVRFVAEPWPGSFGEHAPQCWWAPTPPESRKVPLGSFGPAATGGNWVRSARGAGFVRGGRSGLVLGRVAVANASCPGGRGPRARGTKTLPRPPRRWVRSAPRRPAEIGFVSSPSPLTAAQVRVVTEPGRNGPSSV